MLDCVVEVHVIRNYMGTQDLDNFRPLTQRNTLILCLAGLYCMRWSNEAMRYEF